MTCAWEKLLPILPPRLRKQVSSIGRETLEELRLRRNLPPELVLNRGRKWLNEKITQEDLNYVVNAATRYSPWTAATAALGYITAPGGHRIGLCGEAVCKEGTVSGLRTISSLCIRVARDFPGIAREAAGIEDSILILGPPGRGKTTLLRDLIRQKSHKAHVCVVDERQELFPEGLGEAPADILSGCPKALGMEMLLKTMGPEYIAVDEITSEEDCRALVQCANCGVKLLATAHAASIADLKKRSVYSPLWEAKVFETVLILGADRRYTAERMSV